MYFPALVPILYLQAAQRFASMKSYILQEFITPKYWEAYEEFEHVLSAFKFDKDDQTSPVANEDVSVIKTEEKRQKQDIHMLQHVPDELVHEHCVYTGIVECGLSSGHASDMQSLGRSSITCEPDPSNGSLLDCSTNMDVHPFKDSNGETSVGKPDLIGTQEMNVRD
ncbi:hypothetical protein C5167_028643 [Papaver somniferum]|nr:hypothetical protein C5167_028643 [Papaver somniferum]